MKFEGEDGIGLAMCSERRGIMTAWWRWSGNLKGREKWDDLKPHREERCTQNPGKRGRPAGQKPGVQHKTGPVDKRKLQLYAPHGVERTYIMFFELKTIKILKSSGWGLENSDLPREQKFL